MSQSGLRLLCGFEDRPGATGFGWRLHGLHRWAAELRLSGSRLQDGESFLRRLLRPRHGHPIRECVDLLYELPAVLYAKYNAYANNGQ